MGLFSRHRTDRRPPTPVVRSPIACARKRSTERLLARKTARSRQTAASARKSSTTNSSSMLFWGPPGCGKNDPSPNHCSAHALRVRPVQRGALRNQRNQGSDGQGRKGPLTTASAPWSSSTKCTASIAPSRTRFFPTSKPGTFAHRRHHGSVLRSDRPAVLADEGFMSFTHTRPSRSSPFCAARLLTLISGLGKERVEASEKILERIAVLANGDARSAYNTLEALALGTEV